ncbi:Ulp1 peptidase [Ranunculus cassubicifolius]
MVGDNKEVLKYKDIVLRDSDLDTLRGPCYLNDDIISFYFRYLFFSSTKTDDILLVIPSESLCLANCDDKYVKEFAQSNNLSSKSLVLFAINDSGGDDSGSHWSILVYDRTENKFLHFDSMEGENSVHAMKVYHAIKEYMGPGGDVSRPQKKHRNKKKLAAKPVGGTKPESVGATASVGLPTFTDCKTPPQSNGYDCGLYVLAIAREVCRCWSLGNISDMLSAIEENVDVSVEVKMRNKVLEIIHDLTKD